MRQHHSDHLVGLDEFKQLAPRGFSALGRHYAAHHLAASWMTLGIRESVAVVNGRTEIASGSKRSSCDRHQDFRLPIHSPLNSRF
jgi:hypothetical protein